MDNVLKFISYILLIIKMAFNILDLNRLGNITLFKGIKEITNSQIVKFTVNFKVDFFNVRSYIKNLIYIKAAKLDKGKLKQLKDINGIPTATSLSNTVEKIISKLTINIIQIVKILTSTNSARNLEDTIKVRRIMIPDFILDMVRTINCPKYNTEITGTNSILICIKNTVEFISRDTIPEKEHGSLLILLQEVNESFKIIGIGSLINVKDLSTLFDTSENYMNASSKPFYDSDGKLESVELKICANHVSKDIERSLLVYQEFIFDNEKFIYFLETSVTRQEVSDILSFNSEVGESGNERNHPEDNFMTKQVVKSTMRKTPRTDLIGKVMTEEPIETENKRMRKDADSSARNISLNSKDEESPRGDDNEDTQQE